MAKRINRVGKTWAARFHELAASGFRLANRASKTWAARFQELAISGFTLANRVGKTRHLKERKAGIENIEDSGEESVKTRVEELESLLNVSLLLNSSLRLEEVLDTVLDQALLVMKAEAGTLWLIDEDSGELIPFVAKGPKAAELKGLRLARGEGIAGRVAETGQPYLVSNVRGDPSWAKRFDDATGFVTRSILCVPLETKRKTIGSLQLVNKIGEGLFSTKDLRLATAFASHAAVVIENSRLYTDLQRLLLSLIRTLASALDARDPYTRGHSERVSQYSLMIAEACGIDREGKEAIQRAALLHDIGKIGIKDDVLLREGPLDPAAWEIMKSHTRIGAQIISEMEPKRLTNDIFRGVLYHQEKYNGNGYPEGLQGEEIPLVARIIAVADAFDAITTDRPYRKGKSLAEALEELERSAGTHLDPHLVKLFVDSMRQYQEPLQPKQA